MISALSSSRIFAPPRPYRANVPRQRQPRARRFRPILRAAAKPADEVEQVPPVLLPEFSSVDQAHREAQWLADIIRIWLDEEWTPLEAHAELGAAAGQAYSRLRQRGESDVSDLVLSLASELLAFDYGETFVNAFEVSNKAVELLMQRHGFEVCGCGTDPEALGRYEALLREEQEVATGGQ